MCNSVGRKQPLEKQIPITEPQLLLIEPKLTLVPRGIAKGSQTNMNDDVT